MIREARAVVLLVLGNAILRLAITGNHVDYVKPEMRIPLLIAGAALSLLGLARLLETVFGRPIKIAAAVGGDHHHEEHDHAPRVAWLLVLPVFAILLIAPPPLGSYAAARDDARVARPDEIPQFPALPAGELAPLTLAEYAVRAVWDAGRTLADRTVQLTGFVTPGERGEWYVTRISLVCCAADSLATKIEVRDAPAPPADTWVQVRGHYLPSADPDPEKAVPVIGVDRLTEVPAPNETYE